MASPKKADCTPEEWALHLAKSKAYRDANRERERARDKARYERDAEKIKARTAEYGARPTTLQKRREKQRARITGVTPALFDALHKMQGGKCAVCDVVLVPGPKTHADHCHNTGEPRGLLCNRCNSIEGFIRALDMTPREFGEKLHKYLTDPPARHVNDLA